MICHHEDTPMLLNISGQKYVLPANCSFLLSDASNLSSLFDYGRSPVIIIINFIYSIWLPCTYKFLYIQFDNLVLNKDCWKTKTKVIIPTNQNRNKKHYEPITNPSNYLPLVQSAGKITRTSCDWFWFCFSLVEKLVATLLSQSLSAVMAMA